MPTIGATIGAREMVVLDLVLPEDQHRDVDRRERDEQQQHRRVGEVARSPVETRISPRTVVKTIAVIGVRRPGSTRPKKPGTIPSSDMP